LRLISRTLIVLPVFNGFYSALLNKISVIVYIYVSEIADPLATLL